MGIMSNKIEREKLRAGDHIYTWRSGYSYSHHGIYVGDGKVIHLTRGPGFLISSSSESQRSNDLVVCCNIEHFLDGGRLYRFEYDVNKIVFVIKRPGTCSLASSNRPEQVLHRAFYLLEHGFGNYNLFDKNCEDFALYCKTGILQLEVDSGRSTQIASLISALGAVIIVPFRFLPSNLICVALCFCYFYCCFRYLYYMGCESLSEVVEVDKLQDHVSNAHSNWEKMMEKDKSAKWSTLPRSRFYAYTAAAIRIWYWTPHSTILVWLRTVLFYILLDHFVSDHLRLNGFKLGDYGAYSLWLLAYFYWRWTSKNTILVCTRLFVFYVFLTSNISDHPRSLKLELYIANTIGVLGHWYWNPAGSTIHQWLVALAYIFLFNFVLKNHGWIVCRAFYACLIIQSAIIIWDWITNITFLQLVCLAIYMIVINF